MIDRRLPRFGGTVARPERRWWILAGALGLLAVLVLAPRPAAAAPAGSTGSPSLVISEVYAPVGGDPQGQWFEIHNTQPISYPLNGLVIATGSKQVTLQTAEFIGPYDPTNPPLSAGSYVLFLLSPDAVARGFVQPQGKKVIPVPDLAPLNPEADALILKTPVGSLAIDAVNWGKPDPAWPNYDPKLLLDPGLDPFNPDPETCLRCSWGRTPPEADTNTNADWTIHQLASPGGTVVPPPRPDFLGRYTDWAGGAASLLLWAAFIIIAIIAYRFERLRDTRTYWQLLLVAPSGLLFYTIVVIIGFGQAGGALTDFQKWLSFPVLAVSGLLTLIAMGIFRRVARTLLEGG